MNNGKVDLGDLVQRGYRFALSLTHNEAVAEDIIQDAWFSVLKIKGPWNRQYLFTTIRHRFIDHCRRENRVAFEPLDHHPEFEQGDTDESNAWFIEENISNANGRFEQMLGKLRSQERAVLYLAAVEGFTAKQIADLLDWPRGTVLSMLHRGRNKIRSQLRSESQK